MRVRRDQLVLGAVAAALLAAIVAFAASTGVKQQQVRPTPVPTASSDRDLFGGSLEPGVRYHTRAFVPPLSFQVGDREWLARDTTSPGYLLIERRNRTAPGGEYPGRSWLAVSRLTNVYDPERGRAVPAPADLYAWMRRHPDLEVGRRNPVNVEGLQGYVFTARVRFRRPAVFPAECIRLDVPCTAIAPNRFLLRGAHMRTFVLRTADDDELVIDLIGLTPRDLNDIEIPGVEVLETLRVTPR